jgi:thioesterase domain-containing protein
MQVFSQGVQCLPALMEIECPVQHHYYLLNECDLAHVHREITHAISHFEQATGGLAPAELRIGIASLADFLQVNDLDAVTRFLHQWADLVREVNGMGHVRFPIPDSSELVETLAPLFDARIELRQQGMEPPEQRWHIPQHDITTAWTILE